MKIFFYNIKIFFSRFTLKLALHNSIAKFKNIFNYLYNFLTSKSQHKLNNYGIAVFETCLTFPVILIFIFFIIEIMNVNNSQAAMDSIALEATLDFVSNKNTNRFVEIIKKYKPFNVNINNIRYYFAIYDSLETMCEHTPFGNETPFWPTDKTEYPPSIYIGENFQERGPNALQLPDITRPELADGSNLLTGKVFVLTVVCDYKFSSGFVGRLFAGGANTNDKQHFLIWGRGIGICN